MYLKIRHYLQEFVFMRSPGVALVRGFSILAQLLFVSLITRLTGATTAGSFFSIYAGVLIASSLSRLGAEYFLVACLPRLTAEEQSHRISTLNVAIGIVSCTFLVLSIIAQTVFESTLLGDSRLAVVLFWSTALLLSINWSNVGGIRGLGDHLKSVSLESFLYVCVFLVALIVFNGFVDITADQLSLLLAGSIGFSVLVGCILLIRLGVKFRLPDFPAIVTGFRESTSFWLASSLAVANLWLPMLLLGQLASPEEVSTYLLGQRLAASLLFGLAILNARFAREYVHLMSTNAIVELGALYRRNTLAQLPFVAIMAVTLVAIAPLIFQFAGITHKDAYAILAVLTLGTAASAACGPILTALIATGNANVISTIIASTLTVSVTIIFAIGPEISGLSLASIVAISMAVQNMAMYVWWRSRIKALGT